MDKRTLLELIRKLDRGEATPEEELLLKSYYNLSEADADGLSHLTDADKASLKAELLKGIFGHVSTGETSSGKPRIVIRSIFIKAAVAASLLVACLSVASILYHRSVTPKVPLVAAEGKRENRLISLPDGSKVIVSWGSTFSCSASFGKEKREVFLSGQAYFDIAHDTSKPFIVHTGKLETTVLGTAFNIKAMPGDEAITVTVTRGRVKISDEKKTLGLITPGREIIYYKKSDSSVQRAVNVNMKFDWKEQDLLVNNVTVEEAALLLQERFGVCITVSDPAIRHERFTTVFLKGEELEPVLKSICEFNGAVYVYDKATGKVVIRKAAATPEN